MPTSEGIVKDVIVPLEKRLDNVLRLPGNPAGSSAINVVVGDIKKQLESMKKEFQREKQVETEVSNSFGIVWQHVDEMLEDPKVKASDSDRIRDKLEEILSDIKNIIDVKKIIEEKKSTVEAPNDPVVSEPRATRPSEAEQLQLQAEKRIQESDAMSHLRLVIENLDTQLKHCLFCLTIFPAGTVIKKRLLIHWWIGENIVTTAEDGKNCFKQLSLRGLVIPVTKEHCVTEHRCKMHPWIHKLLMSIATSNAFLEFDTDGTPSEDYSRTHRAFLRKGRTLVGRSNQKRERGNETEEDDEDEDEEEEEDRALTLYNIDAKYVEFESSWFSGKKELGALQLGRWQNSDYHHIEISGRYFLEDLGACKNLRYLSLRGMSRVESLPDSISNLSKLAVLDLRACHNLEKLTPKVSSLENLEYLDVSECYLLDQLPKGLKHLTKLEVLKGFVIAHATGKDPCRLSELAALDKLRKLSVSVGHGSNEGELQILTNEFKTSLTSLTITWGVVVSKKAQPPGKTTPRVLSKKPSFMTQGSHQKKQETNSPQPAGSLSKLVKLDIRGFPGSSFPEWISPLKLPSLKKLYIRGGRLETFGQVKDLGVEVLRLRFLKYLSCNASTQNTLFPNLKFVEIQLCLLLSSWQKRDGLTVKIHIDATTAASPTQVAPDATRSSEIEEEKDED